MDFDPKLCRNESEVESKLIVSYLLPELGYQPHTWHQEVAFGSIRLDFLAFAVRVLPLTFDGDAPLSLVIEAKSPKRNLDKHVPQLKNYLRGLRVDYGLLTNGIELRIYERIGKNVQIMFQCPGEEITERIEEIKRLVGRDFLQQKQARAYPVIPNTLKKRRVDVKVIAVYHNKGGVGKTTVSVNLAAALRTRGHKVLLVDLDSQANSTFATGLVKFQFEEDDNLKDNNVFHVLESGDFNLIPDVARKSDFFNTPEVDVVPSHISLIEGQYKLNRIKASQTRLLKKLKPETDNYDFVIIDTPPSRDLYAEIAMITADHLIIPSDLKPFANQGLSSVQSFLKDINEFRDQLGREALDIIGVLPSKISTNSKFLEKTFPKQKSTIIDHYNMPVMNTVIHERSALSHCVNQMISVGDLDVPEPSSIFAYAQSRKSDNSASQAALEFENLAEEILKKIGVS
ncbi:MAG: AAA family ATPase [Symploca sp. SIO2B6]|nr:AAA family ATPase [Symploca sp. SIO2B6]